MTRCLRLLLCACVLGYGVLGAQSATAQREQAGVSGQRVRTSGYGLFEIRGQYGRIPRQPAGREPDYEWWQPGRVGFWEYHLEAGGTATLHEHLTARLALSTTGRGVDRDFALWGNEVTVNARLKAASIRLDRVWSRRVAIEGGRQPVEYPLFTTYDYVGGRLIVQVSPQVTFDWGQWQVFEGRTLDRAGQSSDDVDLWGPRLTLQWSHLDGSLYALVHSKAGGNDGIGHNVKMAGWSMTLSRVRRLLLDASGLVQRGETTAPVTGRRTVRAWALRGRAEQELPGRVHLSVEYWAGSSDRPQTTTVEEGFQQFGYRNTLDKSSLFYRPGLTDLRLFRGGLTGSTARVAGRVEVVRIGVGSTGRGLGTELSLAVEYRYSDFARLRWRVGTTGNGHRIQMFELSCGVPAVPRPL